MIVVVMNPLFPAAPRQCRTSIFILSCKLQEDTIVPRIRSHLLLCTFSVASKEPNQTKPSERASAHVVATCDGVCLPASRVLLSNYVPELFLRLSLLAYRHVSAYLGTKYYSCALNRPRYGNGQKCPTVKPVSPNSSVPRVVSRASFLALRLLLINDPSGSGCVCVWYPGTQVKTSTALSLRAKDS